MDALAVVFDLVRFANINVTDSAPKKLARGLLDVLTGLGDILGLIVLPKKETLDEDIEKQIEARQEARKARNFALADEIRDRLKAQGIELLDTREGVKWRRI